MDLTKMKKIDLWYMAIENGIIKGNTSLYVMDGYSKKDLIELLSM